jgi:hypothetical protein
LFEWENAEVLQASQRAAARHPRSTDALPLRHDRAETQTGSQVTEQAFTANRIFIHITPNRRMALQPLLAARSKSHLVSKAIN